MICLLAGCFLGVLVSAGCWVSWTCPVLLPWGFSPGCSHVAPWGPPHCPVCRRPAGKGWVPVLLSCGQGSWVEWVTRTVAAASPEGQPMAPASCKQREQRGAGKLLHPPPSSLVLGTSGREGKNSGA